MAEMMNEAEYLEKMLNDNLDLIKENKDLLEEINDLTSKFNKYMKELIAYRAAVGYFIDKGDIKEELFNVIHGLALQNFEDDIKEKIHKDINNSDR